MAGLPAVFSEGAGAVLASAEGSKILVPSPGWQPMLSKSLRAQRSPLSRVFRTQSYPFFGAACLRPGPQYNSCSRLRPACQPKRPFSAAASAAGSSSAVQQSASDLWLIVGLGNPGPKYHDTRHNVGFWVVEALAQRAGVTIDKQQHNAQVARAVLWGKRLLLAKPSTYMNNSGQSVSKLAQYYKVPLSQVLLIFDDLDLDPGAVRLRAKGGHGGHNGMRSVLQHWGGQSDFPRIRLGIGRPNLKEQVADYVLQPFSRQQQPEVARAVQESLDIVRTIFSDGLERAMSGVRVPA